MGQTSLLPELIDEPKTEQTAFTLVQVAVNYPLFTTFDYKVAGKFDQDLSGYRVKVSFGRSKQANEIGIIVSQIAHSDYDENKLKFAILMDKDPLLPRDILLTLLYGADYYHYPVGQVLFLGLPKLLREGLPATYKEIPGLELMINESEIDKCIQQLRSNQQRELLLELKDGPKRRRALREQGYTSAQELALVKRGFARKVDLANNVAHVCTKPKTISQLYLNDPLILNDQQQHVVDAINAYNGYGIFLINGVTGSGKTEVYLQIIAHTLMQGKKALILVPEIALTPQTFKRFFHRFKVPIATLHSTLSDRERLDGFLDMKLERAMILIGTRSALFTPIPNLGLIVIDEEHDSSFKQTDGFRYHTRTLAIYRAQITQCKVVLGSATPSLDTLYQVSKGHYKMLFLTKRAKQSRLPHIQLIDIKKNPYTEGRQAGVGQVLEDMLGINSVRHQQSILFINRRGFSRQMICNACEKILMCPHCDIPMTVHRSLDKMLCHICNYEQPIPDHCPYCGSTSLSESGVGTEQVEKYLRNRFMDVGIERVDRDSITSKVELDATLDRIRNHASEIIVGTQMLAKGHDFPDVTLVGILNVDIGFFSDDFRSLEQTVQLITQVAGRAGRAKKPGTVLIQTMFPEHQLMLRIASPNFNYTELAMELLTLREAVNMPPYTFQAVVMANSLNPEVSYQFLNKIVIELLQYEEIVEEVEVSPVLPDRIEKKNNRYHFHFLLTSANREKLKLTLNVVVNFSQKIHNNKDLRFNIDVDPFSSP